MAGDINYKHTVLKDLVKKTTQELLEKMGLSAQVSVEDDAKNEALVVQVDTEDAGIFIGRHGETISSFQLILNQIIASTLREEGKDAEWPRILVNCGDYRERQEESLRNLAISTAARAKETGQPQSIYDLAPAQRRIVHMTLSEDSMVETRSEGEGRERYLVVSPVKQ